MRFAGKIISALPVLIIAVSTLAHAANEWIGRASVIDADTIEIHGTRIRIYGIDAIEARQRCQHNGQDWNCAKDSAFALDDYLKGKVVTCNKSGRDSWKRKVARCTVGGEDLGMWLVRSGWALDFERYSKGEYDAAEREAATAKRGIHQGTFQRPCVWRRKRCH